MANLATENLRLRTTLAEQAACDVSERCALPAPVASGLCTSGLAPGAAARGTLRVSAPPQVAASSALQVAGSVSRRQPCPATTPPYAPRTPPSAVGCPVGVSGAASAGLPAQAADPFLCTAGMADLSARALEMPPMAPVVLGTPRCVTPQRVPQVLRSTSVPAFYQAASGPSAIALQGAPPASGFLAVSAAAPCLCATFGSLLLGAPVLTTEATSVTPPLATAGGSFVATLQAAALPSVAPVAPAAAGVSMLASAPVPLAADHDRARVLGNDAVYRQYSQVLADLRRKRSWSPVARTRRTACDTPPRLRMREARAPAPGLLNMSRRWSRGQPG